VLAIVTTAGVYGQLILGAVMRHTEAGLAIPDFPFAFGGVIPPLQDPKVQIHFAHRIGALVVALLAAWTVTRIVRAHGDEPLLRRPAFFLAALLLAQVGLGALTIWTRKAVIPTTAHVLGGAAVLATSFLITLRSHRLILPRGSEAGDAVALRMPA
jgi:cytochrome c oxidase assembly protein subunit 15